MNEDKNESLDLSNNTTESNSSNSIIIGKSKNETALTSENTPNKKLKLPPDITINFGKCKICDETSSGIHYGIATCEGCKGFYKRSLDKYHGYSCSNNNNCVINKITRNRCKSCRFNKCSLQGMSIDCIRMGRIPISEKLKSRNDQEIPSNNFSRETLNKEISALLLLNQTNQLNKSNMDPILYYPKEFKYWLNSQLDSIRTNNHARKYNEIIIGSNSFESYEIINLLNQPNLLDFSSGFLPNENELMFLSLMKDRVFQLYRIIVKESYILNDSRERLKNKNYFDSNIECSSDELTKGIFGTISEYTKWVAKLAKSMPAFDQFDAEDFAALVSNSSLSTIPLHINEFFINNESYQITPNGYQMSRNRMNLGFGTFVTSLFFLTHDKIKKLDLTENEKSIYYPFAISCCKESKIKDRQKLIQLKTFYTKMLLYEFKLTGRDSKFLEDFKECNELVAVADMYRETYGRPNKK